MVAVELINRPSVCRAKQGDRAMSDATKTYEIRYGRVVAQIWERETGDGKTERKTSVGGLYKQDGKWKLARSFWPNELPLVQKALDDAYTYLHTPNKNGKGKDQVAEDSEWAE